MKDHKELAEKLIELGKEAKDISPAAAVVLFGLAGAMAMKCEDEYALHAKQKTVELMDRCKQWQARQN